MAKENNEKKSLTRIDLDSKLRDKMSALLNESLADLTDLRLSTKQAHWNIRGANFIALHEMFDEFAADLDGHIDDVAERVTALGGLAEGTLQAVHKASALKEYPLKARGQAEHLEALATAYALVAKRVRAAIDSADAAGDADTADLFTGISRDLDKKLWFLEAHQYSQ